jgi:hypothetical protein
MRRDSRRGGYVLDEMNIGVARPQQFAVQGKRRPAGEQHDRQAVAEDILDRHAGVGGAGVNTDEHGLPASGSERVARRHVNGDHSWGRITCGCRRP